MDTTNSREDFHLCNILPINLQIFYAGLFSLNWISYGYVLGYSATIAIAYQRVDLMTPKMTGIYVSVLGIGGFLGTLISHLSFNCLLRFKKSTLVYCLLLTLGWYIHLYILPFGQAETGRIFSLLLVGRLILGFGMGFFANDLLVGRKFKAGCEFGRFLELFRPICLALGYFLSFFVGLILIRCDTNMCLPLLTFLDSFLPLENTVIYVPWLGICLSSFSTIITLTLPKELESLIQSESDYLLCDTSSLNTSQILLKRIIFRLNRLKISHVKSALFVSLGLGFFQQTMGISPLIFNPISTLSDFFGDCKDRSIMSFVCVYIWVIFVVSAFVIHTQEKLRYFRRSVLLYFGSFVIFCCHVALALIYYNRKPYYEIGAGFTLLLMFAFSCTWGPIPWLIVSDLFPNKQDNIGVTLCTSMAWFSMFVVSLIYTLLRDSAYFHLIFFVSFLMAVLSVPFVIIFVQETKNVALSEV